MDSGNRKHDRQSVSLAGVLTAEGNPEGTAIPCRIEDLSVGGARVAPAGAIVDIPPRIMLGIEKFGAYSADVVWRRPPQIGLKFRASAEEMAEVLTAIALHA